MQVTRRTGESGPGQGRAWQDPKDSSRSPGGKCSLRGGLCVGGSSRCVQLAGAHSLGLKAGVYGEVITALLVGRDVALLLFGW